MPELPEVEIIKNQLKKTILNQKILSVYITHLNLHGKPIPDLSILKNQQFLSVYRRNKYLILETENNFLVMHLGMTGQLIYSDKLPEKQKHIHIKFEFQNSILYYQDIRRFGSAHLFSKEMYSSYKEIPLFSKLGYEPLDKSFSFENLNECINNSSGDAKKFIMDGNKICGIGNIYASEILFLTKINPMSEIKNIPIKKRKLLFENIIKVLDRAVQMGGSTISDFVHVNGNMGKMQEHYYVYAREGQPCKICNTNIKKIKQHQRSTFYCPNCQK